jgi:hypothetical protein
MVELQKSMRCSDVKALNVQDKMIIPQLSRRLLFRKLRIER